MSDESLVTSTTWFIQVKGKVFLGDSYMGVMRVSVKHNSEKPIDWREAKAEIEAEKEIKFGRHETIKDFKVCQLGIKPIAHNIDSCSL